MKRKIVQIATSLNDGHANLVALCNDGTAFMHRPARVSYDEGIDSMPAGWNQLPDIPQPETREDPYPVKLRCKCGWHPPKRCRVCNEVPTLMEGSE